MSFESLLNHHCDIYHSISKEKSPGYGLPSAPAFSYPAEPDIEQIPCHFNVGGSNIVIVQGAPMKSYQAKIKLQLPIGTDIWINDKIVDCDTGYEYTAGIPRNIRNHHIIVELERSERQAPL